MKTAVNHMTSSVLRIDQSKTINIETNIIYANEEGWLLIAHKKNCIGIIARNRIMLKVLIKKTQ